MWVWVLATLAAYFVKGVCGFASTMVFTALVSFASTANVAITPVDLLLGLPTNAIIVGKYRRYIQPKIVLPLLAAVVAGSIPGVLFLKNLDARLVKLLFGALIAFLGLQSFIQPRRHPSRLPRPALYAVGALSGLLTGLYGVGALLAAYFSRVQTDTRAFKANMCVVFLAEDIFRLIAYLYMGILTPQVLRRALLLAPWMALGMAAGLACSAKINESRLRTAIHLFLIVSGVALFCTSL